MNTSIASAASASSTNSHMGLRSFLLPPLSVLLLLASCASTPPAPVPAPPRPPAAIEPGPTGPVLQRGDRARWVRANWADLPGWGGDALAEWWPAFVRGCARPASGWAALCQQAQRQSLGDDVATLAWVQSHLQPWRVEALDANAVGLATGYFEPLLVGSRQRTATQQVPLYGAPPADASGRRPSWTRQQIDSDPAIQAALAARTIAWVADPLDALLLHIQGSGRLQVQEAGGSERLVRLAFGGHNDQPYRSVGRWLIEQGELRPGEASWPAIKDWARRNPARANELLWQNPRYVYFKEEPLPDPTVGPRGAQAVPLTPGRSIAVDPQAVPYGTPVWLDTTEPLSSRPLQRLVMAQDTGSAIVGAVRADYFWGWGGEAEAQAGRMKQPLRMWVLLPQ